MNEFQVATLVEEVAELLPKTSKGDKIAMRKKDNKRKNGDVNLILFSHVNAFGSGNTINTGSQKNEPDNAGIIETTPAEEQSGLERQKPKGRIRTFLFNAFSHIHFFSDNSFGGKDEESQENGSTSESMPREKGGTTVKVGLASDAHFLSDNKINITIGVRKKYLKELADNMDKRFDELERTYPMKVVDAVVTKFEEDIIPKFVKEVVDETGNKITEMQTTIKEWHDDSTRKINNILDEVATVAAGQEAQGEDLKKLLESKEKQDEINRRLDLYMTSTEKAIAENTMQLKNVEKMLLLKEEQDREHFDAVKKGIEGLGEESKDIKEKIGELLTKDDAFAKFQELQDQNKEIKDILEGMCEYLKKQDTDLQDEISTAYEEQIPKIKEAIAASDAKLLGMIMPEIANLKDQNNQILINQDTQTTILNSILSGQQGSALQYVAMSEKLDNFTELVSALGTKMQNQSFDDNKVVELLKDFAKSQEAMFAAAFEKVAKKDDLKHLDTGIDSIIEKLHDDSVELDEVCAVVENMANKIDSIARTSENNSQKLDDIHKILLSSRAALDNVADCDRCHSAKSMFYKCQICGYDERTNATPGELKIYDEYDERTNATPGELSFYDEGKNFLIVNTRLTKDGVTYISELATHKFGNVKVDPNAVEKIVFDICDECKGACDQCNKTMTIKLKSSTYSILEGENNIWGYFTNLKAISFAKTKNGKAKYILGSDLLREDDLLSKIYTTTFYGGRYLGKPEPGICNIKCDSVDSNIVSEVLNHIDKTGSFHQKVKGSSEWRTPTTRKKEVK